MRKKPLFTTTDLKKPLSQELYSQVNTGDVLPSIHYTGKAANFLNQLQNLLSNQVQHIDFMTAGNLSLYNMIEVVLKKYGPCLELYISTYAMKEAAARALFNLKQQKLIGSLHGIFDYRMKTVDTSGFQMAQKLFFRYELTKNHSKVILIEYRNRYITIVSSANMSNNPRIEAGFISLSQKTFYFHKSWMLNVFDGKKMY